jgi:hypothetical protein
MPKNRGGVERKNSWLDALHHHTGGRVEVIHRTFRARKHRFYIERDEIDNLVRAGIPVDWKLLNSGTTTFPPTRRIHEEKSNRCNAGVFARHRCRFRPHGPRTSSTLQAAPHHRSNTRPTPSSCHSAVVVNADIDFLPRPLDLFEPNSSGSRIRSKQDEVAQIDAAIAREVPILLSVRPVPEGLQHGVDDILRTLERPSTVLRWFVKRIDSTICTSTMTSLPIPSSLTFSKISERFEAQSDLPNLKSGCTSCLQAGSFRHGGNPGHQSAVPVGRSMRNQRGVDTLLN